MLNGTGVGGSGMLQKEVMLREPYFGPRSSFVMVPRLAAFPLSLEQVLPDLTD